MSIFGSSQEQKEVEAATSDLLIATDWGAITELNDKIKVADDGGKNYLKAIVKRIQNKNSNVAQFALDLLGSAVSNCGDNFHRLLNNQSVLDDIVKVGLKKGQQPEVRDKILTLILSWAEAFAKHPEFKNFWRTYQTLRQQQVQFPARDPNASAPVFTPKPRPKPAEQKTPRDTAASPRNTPASPRGDTKGNPDEPEPDNPLSWASPEYNLKVRSELQEVMNYVNIVREMLAAVQSSQQAKQNDTLKSLMKVLHEMQSRLTRLLVEIEAEDLVDLCVQVNDHIQIAIFWYNAKSTDHPFEPPVLPMPRLIPEAKVDDDDKGDGKGSAHASDAPHEIHVGPSDDADDDGFDAIANRHAQPSSGPKQQNILSLDAVQIGEVGESDGSASGPGADSHVSAQELEDLLALTDNTSHKAVSSPQDTTLDDLLKEAHNP